LDLDGRLEFLCLCRFLRHSSDETRLNPRQWHRSNENSVAEVIPGAGDPDFPATGSVVVGVYDSSNVFLGNVLISNIDYGFVNPLAHLGIVTTGGDDIGRINIADGNLANFVGIDDISAYTALPEPGTLALAGFTRSGLLGARLRRG
jgi:hypothetical protein